MAMMIERKYNVLIQFFLIIKTENAITTHAFLVVRIFIKTLAYIVELGWITTLSLSGFTTFFIFLISLVQRH
jgi:hypothetical protein